MPRPWVVAPSIDGTARLAYGDVHPLMAQLLWNRGIKGAQEVTAFLNPDFSRDVHDPYLFRDMAKAVERILAAREKQERITVHGDYDADGVCGSAILTATLEALGCTVDVYLPDRAKEGYGMNLSTVAYLKERGTKLIITNDCGIANAVEIAAANAAGIDTIITDHHHVPEQIPPAYAIIHPLVGGETYPFKGLTGGGVAWKLACALAQRATRDELPLQSDRFGTGASWPHFTKWLLDLVAISTVADMGPLNGENRTLLTYGLMVLNRTRRTGLKALIANCRLSADEPISARTVAFSISPRINAAGRMDHANRAYALLNAREAGEAQRLALELEDNNKQRQDTVRKMQVQAAAQIANQIDQPLYVVEDLSWSVSTVGLVASRLVEQYHRPVFAVGTLASSRAGSGRSVEGVDILKLLDATKDCYERYGGHKAACGFTLKLDVPVAQVTTALQQAAKNVVTEEILSQPLVLDAEVPLGMLTWDCYNALEGLKPFGKGNDEPLFATGPVLIKDLQFMGADKRHARLYVASPDGGNAVKAMYFSGAGDCAELRVGDIVNLAFQFDVSRWNGNAELFLRVSELKRA